MIVEVRKLKGAGHHDFYDCRRCGRRWKSTAKSIGHSKEACDRYHKRVYGWV
jgi:hypothetical protein